MKTAAAYIRVSTDDQIEYSPDSQLKAIRKYAKEHELILPEEFIFVDEGISGRKADKRPSFQRMIGTAKLKPKPFDVILLWKFSRFARNREDSIVYKSMLRKQCGIDVVSISEQLGEDKTSILIEALIEAMDEYYSVNLAEEVRRGMNEKFSRGEVVSQPPFGYIVKNGVFVPDEEKAPIVQRIFNDFNSGIPTRQIAQKLNSIGVRSTKGNSFENRTVEYILTNPVYIGKLRRSKNGRDNRDRFHQSAENTLIVDGRHESIIDTAAFDKAQQKLAEIKKNYKKYARQSPVEFMLKGLVRCDTCGSTLVMQHSTKSLQCHKYAKGACKVSHSISLTKINKIVIDRISSDLDNDFFNVRINPSRTAPENENKPIISAIAREEKKLERVREAYEAGVDTLDEYKENKSKILKTIENLKTKLKTENNNIDPTIILKETVARNLKILEAPDASETLKNKLLRSFADSIIFIKPKGIVEIHYHV